MAAIGLAKIGKLGASPSHRHRPKNSFWRHRAGIAGLLILNKRERLPRGVERRWGGG